MHEFFSLWTDFSNDTLRKQLLTRIGLHSRMHRLRIYMNSIASTYFICGKCNTPYQISTCVDHVPLCAIASDPLSYLMEAEVVVCGLCDPEIEKRKCYTIDYMGNCGFEVRHNSNRKTTRTTGIRPVNYNTPCGQLDLLPLIYNKSRDYYISTDDFDTIQKRSWNLGLYKPYHPIDDTLFNILNLELKKL